MGSQIPGIRSKSRRCWNPFPDADGIAHRPVAAHLALSLLRFAAALNDHPCLAGISGLPTTRISVPLARILPAGTP